MELIREVLRKVKRKILGISGNRKQLKRVRKIHLITKEERRLQKERKFNCPNLFSIVTPLYNTPEKYLIELIQSLQKQTYSKWEVCLVNGSDENHKYVEDICLKYAKKDSRIRYQKISENRGISENTNECLGMVRGDYIGLVDHDDFLHESALYEVMKVIEETSADFIYTDEAKFSKRVEDAMKFNFKPDFGKDELRSHNYICHFTVFKKSLLRKIGGFRSEYDGSQDHDMVLRLSERAEKIVHIPKILYYWRVHPTSVSMDLDSKSYAVDAAIRAVTDQLHRTKEYGKVESNLPYRTIYRIHYDIDATSSILIALYNVDSLTEYNTAKDKILEKTTYNNIEIVPIFETGNCFATKLNETIKNMEQQYVIIMDASCLPISNNWIEELLMYAQRKDVCAVSPKGYFTDKTIAYAGISLDRDSDCKIKYICRGRDGEQEGYEAMLKHVRNVTAAWQACCMISKNAWEEIDGFSDNIPGYEIVDFCLKGWNKKMWTVWTCFSEILFLSKNEETIEKSIVQRFEMKWNNKICESDPFMNSNLKELGVL